MLSILPAQKFSTHKVGRRTTRESTLAESQIPWHKESKKSCLFENAAGRCSDKSSHVRKAQQGPGYPRQLFIQGCNTRLSCSGLHQYKVDGKDQCMAGQVRVSAWLDENGSVHGWTRKDQCTV